MPPIFHITTVDAWRGASANGAVTAASLDTEGFIHGSTPAQVLRVADALFCGHSDMLLLCIDSTKVDVPIHYESADRLNERFPHFYGPINLDAVARVVAFPPKPDGTFDLPAEAVDWAATLGE